MHRFSKDPVGLQGYREGMDMKMEAAIYCFGFRVACVLPPRRNTLKEYGSY